MYLPQLQADRQNPDIHEQLMIGALLAGQGSDYAPSGLASAMAHCIGARYDQDNGIITAILLPHAMRFNADTVGDRLALIAGAMGQNGSGSAADAASMAIPAVEAWLSRLGTPARLREIAVPENALPRLAEDIAADWFLHQNPRRITGKAELLQLLQAAW